MRSSHRPTCCTTTRSQPALSRYSPTVSASSSLPPCCGRLGRGAIHPCTPFHDNLITRVLDHVLVPAWGVLQRLVHRLRRDGLATVRREPGYRRTCDAIGGHAERSGYRIGRVRYSCFALELKRILLPEVVLKLAHPLDRRLHMFNSSTVFELLPLDSAGDAELTRSARCRVR